MCTASKIFNGTGVSLYFIDILQGFIAMIKTFVLTRLFTADTAQNVYIYICLKLSKRTIACAVKSLRRKEILAFR